MLDVVELEGEENVRECDVALSILIDSGEDLRKRHSRRCRCRDVLDLGFDFCEETLVVVILFVR